MLVFPFCVLDNLFSHVFVTFIMLDNRYSHFFITLWLSLLKQRFPLIMDKMYQERTILAVDNVFRPNYSLWVFSLCSPAFLKSLNSNSVENFVLASFLSFINRFYSVDGVRVLTRFDAAVYTARRTEMLEIVETTLFYLIDRPVVHSEVSGLPYMVSFFVSGAFI